MKMVENPNENTLSAVIKSKESLCHPQPARFDAIAPGSRM